MRRLLLSGLMAFLGCANLSTHEGDLCPESASLSCLTTPQCSYDRDRHCKVCQCAKPIYDPVPPDQRIRQ